MNQKIAELTDKIYQEGVERGEEEAKKIVSDAEKKAEKIVSDAKKEAERVAEQARTEAEELKRNTESEIKLAGEQALSTIRQQIRDIVTARALEEPVGSLLSNPDLLKELVNLIAQNWKSSEKQPSLEVILPENKRSELESAFKGGVLDVMKKGVNVSFSRGIKGGFQIAPEGEGFKISLTDEDFNEFFKEYLRPRTRSFLFDT